MRVLLRHLTRKRSGRRATREQSLEIGRITIGRGTDNVLQVSELMVALHHCVLEERGGQLHVERVEAGDVLVNGSSRPAGALAPGDVLRIGHHELRVGPRTADGAWTIELEQVAPPANELEALQRRTQIGIERGLLTRRALSWAVVAVTLALCFVPLLARSRRPLPNADGPPRSRARGLVDRWWSSGPLTLAHRHLAGRCPACHAAAFVPVADAACAECHAGTSRHAPPGVTVAALDDTRCASCHPEHRGRRALLASAVVPCAGCHATLARDLPATDLDDVSDFAGGHPEFRITVPAGGTCTRLTVGSGTAPALPTDTAEPVIVAGGLRFSHATHLKPGLRDKRHGDQPARQRSLGCPDCHVPDAGGASMRAVTFRERCQPCHDLAFSALDPAHEAPHARPARVRADLEAFFSFRALVGAAVDEMPELGRRRPGEDWDERQRPLMLAWVRDKTRTAWEDLFGPSRRCETCGEQGTCGMCHTLTGGGAEIEVAPVALVGTAGRCEPGGATTPVPAPSRWMPLAAFSHAPHTALECTRCHAPERARTATGMLPGIATCRPCHHRGWGGERRRLDDCSVCHRFHVDRYGPMRPGTRTAAGREP